MFVYLDELGSVFVKLFDVSKGWIDGGFDGPVDVHNPTKSTKFYQHFWKLSIRFKMDY